LIQKEGLKKSDLGGGNESLDGPREGKIAKDEYGMTAGVGSLFHPKRDRNTSTYSEI